MKKIKNLKILLFSIVVLYNFLNSSFKTDFLTTLQVILNVEKIYDLPVYKVADKDEKYITIKDLAKILNATLTYYSKGKYISFNCRRERIYFYVNKNYFIWSKRKFYLPSEIINYKNRIFLPISILTHQMFNHILNVDTQYRKDENVLIINWLDSITLSYYVIKDKALIEVKLNTYSQQPFQYEYLYDEDNKITLTFLNEKVHSKEYRISGSIISKIKLSQQNGDAIIEIFPNDIVEIKKEEQNDRIILEIYKVNYDILNENQQYLISDKETTSNIGVNQSTTVVSINRFDKSLSVKKPLIVIDPGHGGEDPGAVGKYGSKEKDINLSVSKILKEKLEKIGFNVILTREEDIFIPLVKRTKFANDCKADLFISIHCNASEKSSGTDRGFEAYFLSENATDPDAVATEKLENEVIRFEKQTEELTKLQKLLWSMIVNEFINESSKLCSLIVNECIVRTNQISRGVKQAGFYVLRGAQMPAVLVEMGFISNPNEELKLIRRDFQELIADGISSAIRKYYENHQY
ncbi:MAG: N-acetylmuramoyl-L-alanine amidase [Elusimicrobiota bacterium]|nr:N-acetylmuramoyl-L-alanine amidase [Endomicrobiia bacterium]MDW8165998.1 N-acetylmuramoyl-L-alanine amidase [Elusimicrobiota bacterium]